MIAEQFVIDYFGCQLVSILYDLSVTVTIVTRCTIYSAVLMHLKRRNDVFVGSFLEGGMPIAADYLSSFTFVGDEDTHWASMLLQQFYQFTIDS